MQLMMSKKEIKEIISNGTYLRSYCPHCCEILIVDDLLKLIIIDESGERGELILSPYLNIFRSESTIVIPDRSIAKDIRCPCCSASLVITDRDCEVCHSSVVKILVEAVSHRIDFYICSRKGCKWHGLSQVDAQDICLEDSDEW